MEHGMPGTGGTETTEEDERKQAKERLRQSVRELIDRKDAAVDAGDLLWDTLVLFQGLPFYTAKHLEFTYQIRGYEMFVDRKDKSITKATAELAYRTAIEIQRDGMRVSGPKKLKTFGASYLYPIFMELGVIQL